MFGEFKKSLSRVIVLSGVGLQLIHSRRLDGSRQARGMANKDDEPRYPGTENVIIH